MFTGTSSPTKGTESKPVQLSADQLDLLPKMNLPERERLDRTGSVLETLEF